MGRKILIVEDNAIVALETKLRLTGLGYTITGVTGTGKDAINLVRTTEPDLVLMDINLKGGMDGISVVEQITSFAAVPVIYITAYSTKETLARAMKTNPVAYLVKPFREQELYRSIEKALGEGAGEKGGEAPGT
ncbi:MAG TPA: response regulator [Methanoregula sp.]|nr:response regulator [Methanoregula sp.]